MRLTLIVPAYNEARTVAPVLERLLELPYRDKEIIVVDDGSTDGTVEVLQAWEGKSHFKVIRHKRNRGKGAAVRTALRFATGDVVVIQDADLEYDPADLPRLLEPIEQGRADAVYGSRFLGAPRRTLYFWHDVANRFITTLSNVLTGFNLSDMETGYKAVRREFLARMRLRSKRFGIEPELTAKLARLGARVYEVPVSYHGRTYVEGKKIGTLDAIAAVFWILRFWLAD